MEKYSSRHGQFHLKSNNKVTFRNQRHLHESETGFCYEAARLLFKMFIFVLSKTAGK